MAHNYNLFHVGKIRQVYEYDKDHLIIHTTDRISAFDYVLPNTVPGKGGILTRISNMWFKHTSGIIQNHLTDIPIDSSIFSEPGEAIVVRRTFPLPVEAIVRQYLVGSAWKEYKEIGMVSDIPLPNNLRMAEKLPEAIFTPSTKESFGAHDININFDEMASRISYDLAEQIRHASLLIFNAASKYAEMRGIIIADTKFEFGLDMNTGELILIDEILTPDSSRFWDASRYTVGVSPESYDKQIVRDYLEKIQWNKKPPIPTIPEDVIEKTARRYREVEDILLS